MPWLSLSYAVPLFLSGTLSAGLAWYAWQRRAAAPCAAPLALFALACAEYAFGYALEVLAPSLAAKIVWAKVEWVGIASLAPLFLAFTFCYFGFGQMLSRRLLLGLAAPCVAVVLLAATNELHGLVWTRTWLEPVGPVHLLALEHGAAFWAFSVYAYGLILLSTGTIASTALYGRGIYRYQSLFLLVGMLAPVLSNLGYAARLSAIPYLNPTPIAFTFSVGLYAFAIFRFRFLEAGPIAWQALVEKMRDGVLVVDGQGRVADLNPALGAALDLRANAAIGRPAREVFARWPGLIALLDAGKEAELEISVGEGQAARDYALSLSLVDAPGGSPGGRLVMFRDVTELRRLEAQFLQAQKMESIGRLASGVAHDFNNLLTAISGHAAFARDALPPEHPARQDVEHVLKGTRRAALLTRQLLAFSRRHSTPPHAVNLNDLILDMAEMLGHLIGEDIELATELGANLGAVRVDPNQIEQAVINLALNARDAMPGGGHLTIRTANVEMGQADAGRFPGVAPGRYVALSVCDTGPGLSDEARAHLFEPFFTTKELGKGTGLGLATVLGIVRQHQGHILTESAPGQGATFTIYLPRVEDAPELTPAAGHDAAGPLPGGSEWVLVVEDDPDVRSWTAQALRGLGYRVLEAASGSEALALLERQAHLRPDLLVTDVVMPQMSGKALADHLQASDPALPVLFISGYATGAIAERGAANGSHAFLAKPFTQAALARQVRELLDGA